jgi:hypothetical protein
VEIGEIKINLTENTLSATFQNKASLTLQIIGDPTVNTSKRLSNLNDPKKPSKKIKTSRGLVWEGLLNII